MSEQPPLFTARELEQFEQDRKRLALNAYLASGLPTSLEHEKLLTEKARLAAQAGETSLSAQPSSLGGGEKGFNFPQNNFKRTNLQHLPIEARVKICSPKHKCWIEATAKFDTGAKEDWISAPLVERLGFNKEQGPVICYQTFTGQILESSEVVRKVTWGSVGNDSRTWVTEFRLAPQNAPFDVLFGSEFISSEQIYTFNESNLILARKRETQDPLMRKEDKKIREERETMVEAEAMALEKERQASAASGAGNRRGKQKDKPRIRLQEKQEDRDELFDDEMDCDD